jgi:DNA-binding transcriptional LysR family regulator
MEIEQLSTTYYLANSGMGATLASTIMIRNSTCNDLVYYKVNSALTTRDFYALVRENSYISRATTRFIEMIKEYYRKIS